MGGVRTPAEYLGAFQGPRPVCSIEGEHRWPVGRVGAGRGACGVLGVFWVGRRKIQRSNINISSPKVRH